MNDGLIWRKPEDLGEVANEEFIIIAHNRGTWRYKADPERVTCVVVYRWFDKFYEFGPDKFRADEIAAWARFNPPSLGALDDGK